MTKLTSQARGSKAEPKGQRTEVEIRARKTALEALGVRTKEEAEG